jgi:hypothetical protein
MDIIASVKIAGFIGVKPNLRKRVQRLLIGFMWAMFPQSYKDSIGVLM